jgi:monoamine oxidase
MKRSLHTRLSTMLREAHAACAEAEATGAPIDEVTAWRAERRAALPRRAVLAGATAAVVAPIRRARAANAPSVVIVGAGLAGLSCARALWQQNGIAASVYEWNTRVGGRVQTLRGYFADGINCEMHGEFISSEHTLMRGLAAAYGLTLGNADGHLTSDQQDIGIYAGQPYTPAALNADWQNTAYKLFRDAVKLAPSATYKHASPTARVWDHMSVTDWVQRYIPDGVDSPFGAFCLADVISEYGSPPEKQSALNLLYILGYNTSSRSGYQDKQAPLPAGTDEKYQVNGGNDLIIAGLAGDLPSGAINLGYQLLAVRETPGKQFISTFQAGAATIDVTSDHVVLAIPPTTLRDVDLTRVKLSPLQQKCIAEATLGNNAKIFLQFQGRPWISDDLSGNLLTDEPVCGGWDAGNTQPRGVGPHARGLYVGFPGGKPGATLATRYGLAYGNDAGPAPAALVTDTLAQLEKVFPGVTASYQAGPRLAYVNDGNVDVHLRGAYSNFLVGQYTAIGGAGALPAGNLHFAGEHTSLEYQGFMEGGVQSGLRAASEIVGG